MEETQLPIVVEEPVSWGADFKTAPDHMAIVNAMTGKVYAVVSTDYRLVRHEDAIREVEEAIAEMPDLRGLETSTGFYNDGGRMYRTYRFPSLSVAIKPDDLVNPTLLLVNSYDLSWSLEVFLGAYRVVCGNGLVVGVDLLRMKRRHSRRLELPLIKEELSSALERFDEQVKEWRKWSDWPLSRGVYTGVMDRMEFGGQARVEIEAKMGEEADGRYEMGFPVLSIWGFFNVWRRLHTTPLFMKGYQIGSIVFLTP